MSYLRLPPSRPGFNFDSWQKSNLLVVVDLLRIDRRVLSSGNEENLPVGKLQVSESGRSPDHKAAAIYPRSFPLVTRTALSTCVGTSLVVWKSRRISGCVTRFSRNVLEATIRVLSLSIGMRSHQKLPIIPQPLLWF